MFMFQSTLPNVLTFLAHVKKNYVGGVACVCEYIYRNHPSVRTWPIGSAPYALFGPLKDNWNSYFFTECPKEWKLHVSSDLFRM